MHIHVDTSELERLAADLDAVAENLRPVCEHAAGDAAKKGNRIAQAFARRSSGAHGKRYPRSFSVATVGAAAFVYGPTAGRAQGGMSFEYGSRNQKPHLDLNRSADIIDQDLPRRVAADVGKLVEAYLG